MTLFEINAQLEELINSFDARLAALVDPETGEVTGDIEAEYDALVEEIERLQMDKEQKRENLCCAVLGIRAEAQAIRNQERILFERRKSLEKKADRLEDIVRNDLNGQKWSSPRVMVTWRNTTSTEIGPEFLPWAQRNADQLLRYKEPEPDKTAIARLLKSGAEVPGCHLELRQKMTIK